jgi:hypothetical protein
MNRYNSQEERAAAIESGAATVRGSTLQDGRKHYALMRYRTDGSSEVAVNYTGTDNDNLDAALAQERRYHFGPHAEGVDGYGAERIS